MKLPKNTTPDEMYVDAEHWAKCAKEKPLTKWDAANGRMAKIYSTLSTKARKTGDRLTNKAKDKEIKKRREDGLKRKSFPAVDCKSIVVK